MKAFSVRKVKTSGASFSGKASVATLLPLLCALAVSAGPAHAQQEGAGPHQEQHAGKHGRFGYRKPDHVNRDGYVSDNDYGAENLAYYGDWNANRIFIFDVDNWGWVTTVEGTGDGPYGIDQQSPEKAYALTRLTESLTIVNNQTFANDGIIPLEHRPRSTNYNPETGLTLVSGGDKAMTSIIKVEKDEVARVIGDDVKTHPGDYGGSLSTGHPLWVTDRQFFMLDRAAREIQLWHPKNGLLSTLHTATSVHHVFQPPASTMKKGDEHIYYAVEEGNRGDNQGEPISPAILRFELQGDTLVETGRVELNSIDPSIYNASIMGAHHAAFRPDGKFIYVGSAEGNLFVIDRKKMKVKKVIEVGMGAGHTTFLSMRDQAIITNHNDTFVSVINTKNHKWVRNVEVADTASPAYKSQAHTSGVSLDMQYFYSAASHDGVFYRINLDTWIVDKTYAVPEPTPENPTPNLLMGSFIWDGDGMM
jgi:DNA-binding beta-propeller fold protein YncE